MKAKLKHIEKERNVKILYACESGSRAWGFASPDSDYDVRFIYSKPIEWYLKVSEGKDAIHILEGAFDAVGWDLKKQLQLLKKSNVPTLEHLFSPIVYLEKETEMIRDLRDIASDCFSSVASAYHYLSMSKKYIEKVDEDMVKLKSLFYALRTSLAARWIVEHKTMPPVLFAKMLSLVADNERDEILELIAIKSIENESYFYPKNELISNLLKRLLVENESYAKTLPAGNPDRDRIDRFLYESLTV